MRSKDSKLEVALLGASIMALVALQAPADETADAAAHQHHHAAAPRTNVSMAEYRVPDITLVRADGASVSLPAEMNDGRPVVLSFIYTSCTTICPLLSQILAEFEDTLGPESDKVHLMSISIDPEADTPARLTEYAKKFGAGPEWQFYTGTLAASVAAQQAFGVYRGDKMSHQPVTLLRAAPGQPWQRFDGFVTPDELVQAYRGAVAGL
jgi:protein SCO1/2